MELRSGIKLVREIEGIGDPIADGGIFDAVSFPHFRKCGINHFHPRIWFLGLRGARRRMEGIAYRVD